MNYLGDEVLLKGWLKIEEKKGEEKKRWVVFRQKRLQVYINEDQSLTASVGAEKEVPLANVSDMEFGESGTKDKTITITIPSGKITFIASSSAKRDLWL